MYNRKSFVVIGAILMSVNNGLGAIFLPYFSKAHFSISPGELGSLAFVSSIIYVVTALNVSKIERRLGLKKSFYIFLSIQFFAFFSINFLSSKWQLLIPFISVGIAQGGWWPLLEGAMCEGQDLSQKKRAISIFNFSWLFGLFIGPSIAGYLYHWNKMLPLWAGLFIIAIVSIVLMFPASLKIAPWKSISESSLEPPPSLPLFIKIGVFLNFVSYLFVGSFRSVLVEFTNPLNFSSTQYGTIQSTLNLGILFFMYLLMKTEFWQYSRRSILSAIALMVFLLSVFSFSGHIYALTTLTFLLGAPVSLFYFSSLFYGMLGKNSGSDHGGHHEAMIGLGQSLGPLISGYLIYLSADPKIMFVWLAILFVAVFAIVFKKTANSSDFATLS